MVSDDYLRYDSKFKICPRADKLKLLLKQGSFAQTHF